MKIAHINIKLKGLRRSGGFSGELDKKGISQDPLKSLNQEEMIKTEWKINDKSLNALEFAKPQSKSSTRVRAVSRGSNASHLVYEEGRKILVNGSSQKKMNLDDSFVNSKQVSSDMLDLDSYQDTFINRAGKFEMESAQDSTKNMLDIVEPKYFTKEGSLQSGALSKCSFEFRMIVVI